LVFGATGNQGTSVICHLVKADKFKVRGVVRDLEEEKSKHFQSKGVEMVRGDISQTLDDNIFKDVDGVFLLTDFWDESTRNREFDLGRSVVDQAARNGIKMLIYSSLVNAEKESNGKWKVNQFTHKARLEEYIRSRKEFQHIGFVLPGFYYQNFQTWFRPKGDSSGNLTITMPRCSRIHGFDVNQLGAAVLKMIENPDRFHGQDICLYGQVSDEKTYVDQLSKRLGKTIKLNSLSIEEFTKLSGSDNTDLGQMMGWMDEYGYFGRNLDIESGRKLIQTNSFEQWLSTLTEF